MWLVSISNKLIDFATKNFLLMKIKKNCPFEQKKNYLLFQKYV
jgi:hypothetical protein